MSVSLVDDFHAEMLGIFNRAGKSTGYWPSYFLRKVRHVGGLRMAKDLLDDSTKSRGFGRLAAEYIVLQARWWPLFTERERELARTRLKEAGFQGVPEESADTDELVYFNNCANRPHADLFQSDAFYDLDTTGVQATQAMALPAGQECVVASKPASDSVCFRWYAFTSERLMREKKPGGKKCRVFLGSQTFSETMPISKACKDPLYACFFDKRGRFKQQSTIRRPRPVTAIFEVEEEELFEGTERRVMATIYERNPAARRRCIEHHGAICKVCGFDFYGVYGKVAEGFIHVHHIKPISEIARKYSVDPIRDLVPVCPNCHAVIHLGKKPRLIDEVKAFIAAAKKS